MKNKYILALVLLSTIVISCKKAGETITEIKNKILDAYWADINNLTVKIEGDEGFVVDFGTSPIGNNPSVFNLKTPYLKNISRTDVDKWEAEIIKSTYDVNGKLSDISYEPTSIVVSTQGNGSEVAVFSNADPKSKTMNKLPSSYIPPADPYQNQPVICDTVSTVTTLGNSISARSFWRGNIDYTDVLVRSALYKPLNHNAQTKCHYKMSGHIVMNGNIIDLDIYFSHKPTQSQVFKVKDYGMWGSITPIEKDHALISFEYNYKSIDNGAVVNVNVSGGKITASFNNVELKYTSTGSVPNCTVSCVLKN